VKLKDGLNNSIQNKIISELLIQIVRKREVLNHVKVNHLQQDQ
jgi:hypothetical protein